ncbi:MAG: c-type cytochrome [Pyrinomonadaceae bacterium]
MNLIKYSVLALIVFTFISCSRPADSPLANSATENINAAVTATPVPTAKDPTAMAADLYTVNCMTCHKDSGKGGKVTVEGKELDPDDLTSAKMKKRTDEKLYGYISDGAEDDGMPAFKDKLSKEEITMLVAHLRKLQSE